MKDYNAFSYPGLTYNHISKLHYRKVGLRPKKWFFQNSGGTWHWVPSTFWVLEHRTKILFAVTFAIVWWSFTQISIGIHKRFLHADFVSSSWSYDFAMLTNRKLLGIESDFFAGCASYITSAAKRWNISGKFHKHCRNIEKLSVFLEVLGNIQNFYRKCFTPL